MKQKSLLVVAAVNVIVKENQMENNPLELVNLMSISGIVVFTMVIVEVLKRVTVKVTFLAVIPVFIYAGIVAGILAFIANRILKLDDGSPYLEGDPFKTIWAAILAALGSSGFYTWLHNGASMRDVGNLMNKNIAKLILIPMLLIVGCQCPEKPIIVNSLDQGTRTIRETHRQWLELLGDDPAKRAQLPVLTPAQQQNLRDLHSDLDETIAEYKSQGTGFAP